MELHCPLPLHYEHIVMAHGGGGRLMHALIDEIQSILGKPYGDQSHDSAVINWTSDQLAFTSDSYVITPLFFKGGDIGHLAVCGTVNDLAMSGAKPLFLSCSLIIEEGLAIAQLRTILQSMKQTAQQAGMTIVTGDTKVVDKGKADGIYINTAGIGKLYSSLAIHPGSIKVGDAVIVSNDLARHGISIMLQREGLLFDNAIESDTAILWPMIRDLIDAGVDIHCLRDLTRGGLASCLWEIAHQRRVRIDLNECDLPVRTDVASACELLGLDPLYIANEGCFALFLPVEQVDIALACLQQYSAGKLACQLGYVCAEHPQGLLTLKTLFGVHRVLDLLSGEQLPRIC